MRLTYSLCLLCAVAKGVLCHSYRQGCWCLCGWRSLLHVRTSTHLSQLRVYVCMSVCLCVCDYHLSVRDIHVAVCCSMYMYSMPSLQVGSKCSVFYHTIFISQLVCAPCLSGPLPSPTQSYANTKGMKGTCIGGQFYRLP